MAKILIIETNEADVALFSSVCAMLQTTEAEQSASLFTKQDPSTTLCDIVFYPKSWSAALKGGEPVQLLPSEFKILHLLAIYEGQIVSHEEICQIIDTTHRQKKSPAPILAANHIMRVRKKMGFDLFESKYQILSIKGIGYRFTQLR